MVNSQAKITVKVHPGAHKNEVSGFKDGLWQIKVAALPVKGKANAELVAFLSEVLGVNKCSVAILKGHTSRSKVVAIAGIDQDLAIRRLSGLSSSGTTGSR